LEAKPFSISVRGGGGGGEIAASERRDSSSPEAHLIRCDKYGILDVSNSIKLRIDWRLL
jgi:hypothetical protein